MGVQFIIPLLKIRGGSVDDNVNLCMPVPAHNQDMLEREKRRDGERGRWRERDRGKWDGKGWAGKSKVLQRKIQNHLRGVWIPWMGPMVRPDET